METSKAFLNHIVIQGMPITDRLIALLWWHYKRGNPDYLKFKELAAEYFAAGYPKLELTRERKKLISDQRTSSTSQARLVRINVRAVNELDELLGEIPTRKTAEKTNTILHVEDFVGTKPYLEKIVYQINASYDYALYDCCAVMMRRLLETLIIELYKKQNRQSELKGADGEYKMFSGLLTHVTKDADDLELGRTTPKHLKEVKDLCDKSAHARHYNANKPAIDAKSHDFRMAAVELKQLTFDN